MLATFSFVTLRANSNCFRLKAGFPITQKSLGTDSFWSGDAQRPELDISKESLNLDQVVNVIKLFWGKNLEAGIPPFMKQDFSRAIHI